MSIKKNQVLEKYHQDILSSLAVKCKELWQLCPAEVQKDYPRFAEDPKVIRDEMIRRRGVPVLRSKDHISYMVCMSVMTSTCMQNPSGEGTPVFWLQALSYVMCHLGATGSGGDIKYYLKENVGFLCSDETKEAMRIASIPQVETDKSIREAEMCLEEANAGNFVGTEIFIKRTFGVISSLHDKNPPNLFVLDDESTICLDIRALKKDWHLYQSLIKTVEILQKKS